MSADLLTVGEVAERLGCSARTVRRRIAAGELGVVRDRGIVRVAERELARFVANRTVAPVIAIARVRTRSAVPMTPPRRGARVTLFDGPDPLPPAA